MKFKEVYQDYINNRLNLDKFTTIGIICFVIVFAGIFGWLYEFIFYYINSGFKTFYWRGSNFLPWINIYAIGSIMILVLNYKLKKKPILVFLISMISTGILEYFAGYFMYKLKNGIRCWDYRHEILSKINIDGFVCLRSVLIFGLSALLLMYIVLPLVIFLLKKINKKLFSVICIVICSIFLIDEFYNLFIADMINTPRAHEVYEKMGINYMDYYKYD